MIMELFLEMIVAVLFSLLLARLLALAIACRGCGPRSYTEEKSGSDVDEDITAERLLFPQKMDAQESEGKRRVKFVEETAGSVDQFGGRTFEVDELKDSGRRTEEIGAECEVLAVEAVEGESKSVESREYALEKKGVQRVDESGDSVGERNERVEVEKSDDVVTGEPEAVRVSKSESEARSEEKIEDLDVEEDDDWEGIERSELEKAFAAAAKFVEESGEATGIRTDLKMELYGLHKVATEGSCREPQPMALMLSARAKWNAWQKLGNMGPEVAMEQYLELLSEEVPGWMEDHSAGKSKQEMETSGISPPNSSSLGLATTFNGKDSKTNADEGDKKEASRLDNRAKDE